MSEHTAPAGRRVRVGHLVVGLACLGLSLVWALWAGGDADGLSVGLLVPLVLVAAGVAGLLAMVPGARSDRGTRTATQPHPAPPGPSTEETRPHRTEES